LTGLTISPQILYDPEARLLVRHGGVQVVLLAFRVDTEALEVDIPTRSELRLDRTRHVDRALHRQRLHAALHDREVDRDHASHLNGTAE